NRPPGLLHGKGHHAGQHGEGEERDFLKEEWDKLWGLEIGPRGSNWGHSRKRPVIQQKQHEGYGDNHGLAHQTKQEKQKGHGVPTPTSIFRVRRWMFDV